MWDKLILKLIKGPYHIPYVVKLNGQNLHRNSSLLLLERKYLGLSQLHIHDIEHEVENSLKIVNVADRDTEFDKDLIDDVLKISFIDN